MLKRNTYICLIIMVLAIFLLAFSCQQRSWKNPVDPNNQLPTVPDIVYNPAAGNYDNPQTVTLSCPLTGTQIHYTTNGTIPTEVSPSYTEPVSVDASFTVNARAYKPDYNPSKLCSATYTINNMVSNPTFYPDPGTFNDPVLVTISTSTPNAEIHYTTNGTIPSLNSALYTSPVLLSVDTVLKAKAFKNNMNDSGIVTGSYTVIQTVENPVIEPSGGTFATTQTITITCPTAGALIYYTFNGTNPTTASALYQTPFQISTDTTVKARAFKSGMNPSGIISESYVIMETLPLPVFNPPAGTYTAYQSVTISCSVTGSTIRFTTDGAEPTSTSLAYTSPINVTSAMTIKAKAFKNGWNNSPTATAAYVINLPTVAIPAFHPNPGTYTTPQTISISCSTSGAEIRYTTNGATPTQTSYLYSTPLTYSTSVNLKAKAFKSGYNPSNVTSASYTITLPTLPTPDVDVPGGVFWATQYVNLSCSVAGAEIHYTTNGLDPTPASPLYQETVTIDELTALRARAYKTGYNASNIMTQRYFFYNYLSAWGRGSEGQNNIVSGNNIVDVAAGYYHAIALYADGTLTGWGYNANGETICPAGNNYVKVAAGYYHNLALRSDGTIAAWGRNNESQCDAPTGGNYVDIAAGNNYSIALKADGTLVGWGNSANGVFNFPAGTFARISAGYAHCLAIKTDGSLAAWGSNGSFQCNVPTGTNYIKISAGYLHSLALRNDGSLVAWGDNNTNQCEVPSGYSYISVAAGYGHSAAIKTDGTLVAWGRNDYQQCNVPSGNNYVKVSAGFFNNICLRRPEMKRK